MPDRVRNTALLRLNRVFTKTLAVAGPSVHLMRLWLSLTSVSEHSASVNLTSLWLSLTSVSEPSASGHLLRLWLSLTSVSEPSIHLMRLGLPPHFCI